MVKITGYGWHMNQTYMSVYYFIYLSRERTIFICYQFFKQIRTKFGGKPIYTDGAHWYTDACRWLRLKHIFYGTQLKNIMERFIQQIKDRTECFDDHFPCRIKGCKGRYFGHGP